MSIEIRPVDGMDQLERWVGIKNAVYPNDPETAEAKALIRAQQSGHTDLIAYLDGEAVGTATLSNDAESERSGRPFMDLTMRPELRGRGIGSALLGAVASHARERGALGLTCEVRLLDGYTQAFFARWGFVEETRFRQCTIDLDSVFPQPAAPGIALSWLNAELWTIVVLPEWRRKGVASSMVAAQLERARDAGLKTILAWVRDNWPMELYQRLGFVEGADGAIVLRGPLLQP